MVNVADEDGRTMLHWAASGGQTQVAELLLRALCEDGGHNAREHIDLHDGSGWTPLHISVSGGHVAIVRALLAHGAEPLALNNTGQMPIHYEASRDRRECADLLLEAARAKQPPRGGDMLNAVDNSGYTALLRSIARGHLEMSRWLLLHGASTSHADLDGNTPLHLATIEQQMETVRCASAAPSASVVVGLWLADLCLACIRLLLDEGSASTQLVAKNKQQQTAFDIAKAHADRLYGMPEYPAAKSLQTLLEPQ